MTIMAKGKRYLRALRQCYMREDAERKLLETAHRIARERKEAWIAAGGPGGDYFPK